MKAVLQIGRRSESSESQKRSAERMAKEYFRRTASETATNEIAAADWMELEGEKKL